MAHSFSTGRVQTSPVQNDSGSVSVSVECCPAGPADENPFRQQQAGLGSRAATAACHRCVGGRYQHHLSPRPVGILDQRRFRCTDGAVRRLARHPGLRQKLRLEVLNSQYPMVGNDFGGPLTRRVLPLAGDLLGQLGGHTLGTQVPVGLSLAASRFAPGHCPLLTSKIFSGVPSVPGVRQVVFGVGGGRDGTHPPVDADRLIAGRQRSAGALDNEARVPVPNAVAVDADTAGLGGQLPRPHDGDGQTAGKIQSAILECESTFGVVQAGQAAFCRLEFASPLALGPFGAKVTQHLLLGHHRAVAQPVILSSPLGQSAVGNPLASLAESFDRPVPYPPAAVPLGQQLRDRGRTRPQPVSIADDVHASDAIAAVRQQHPFLPDLEADVPWAVSR